MKSCEIDDKYKWDLTLILKNDEEFYSLIETLSNDIDGLSSYEGKLNCKQNIVEFFEKDKDYSLKLNRAGLYAMLKVNQDTTNSENLRQMDKVEILCTKLGEKLAFLSPELAKLSNKELKSFMADPELSNYSRIFESVLKSKPHTLEKNEEKIMAGIGAFSNYDGLFSMLDSVEIKMKPVKKENGEKVELTHATYGMLTRDPNPNVRKQAHLNMHKAFAGFNLTISQNYINQLKKSDFVAKTYKFKSCFDRALFNEEVDKKVYNTLVKNVKANLSLFFEYVKAKKQALNLDKFLISDIFAPVGSEEKFAVEFDEAYSIVEEALTIFGDEYLSILKKAKNNRWIDVYPTEGKSSGAFSVSNNTGNPFVLLNYKKTYNDVSTIAHEMGHSLHSYYSEKYQPYEKSDYVIFVAEVASTVNEILLCKHLLKKTEDKEFKKFLLASLIEEFYATVYKQTMYSEFEYKMHSKVNKGEPISFEELNNQYNALQRKYLGGDIKRHKFARYEWSRIPHFYRPFYVYKYATGFISAVAIVKNIEQNGQKAIDSYIEFLKSGSKTDPVSLLKIAGADISSQDTFDNAFKFFSELVEEFKTII